MTQAASEVHGSVAIPEAEHRIEPTSQSRIDEALSILDAHKGEWVALDIDERLELLDQAVRLAYEGEPSAAGMAATAAATK